MPDWKNYQEEAAAFFRTLGLNAETDIRLQGTRTAHEVDVVVKSVHAGFNITWLVECKHWRTPISKLHVLGLRQIVIDLGADRGILLSEAGFQSGAVEAANLTNVQLTSLAALRESAKNEIFAMRLRELFDRVEACSERYWGISKADRIDMGLRPDVGQVGYSGDHIISYCRDVLSHSLRGRYPIEVDNLQVLAYPHLQSKFSDPNEVVLVLEHLAAELERKLAGSSR
jgi:hypothetical protein